jgi:hypothetical protein
VGVQFFVVRLVTWRDMRRALPHGVPGGNGGDAPGSPGVTRAHFGHVPMPAAVIMAL